MGFSITSSGSTNKTESFLAKIKGDAIFAGLEKHAAAGVAALRVATPSETGLTAAAWYYTIEKKLGSYTINFCNSRHAAGAPIVILLNYGHGTGTGGYVQGRDFIMPALLPIFDQLAAEAWKVVTSA